MFEQVIDLVNFKHICYLFFNTKVFQILYSTYHSQFSHHETFKILNFLSYVYVKNCFIFKLDFARTIFSIYFIMHESKCHV